MLHRIWRLLRHRLLDEGDHLLTHGFAGPALLWMLHVALAEQSKPIALSGTT